jgi:hypothetical protein
MYPGPHGDSLTSYDNWTDGAVVFNFMWTFPRATRSPLSWLVMQHFMREEG